MSEASRGTWTVGWSVRPYQTLFRGRTRYYWTTHLPVHSRFISNDPPRAAWRGKADTRAMARLAAMGAAQAYADRLNAPPRNPVTDQGRAS